MSLTENLRAARKSHGGRLYLAAYSAQIDDRTPGRLMAAWFTEVGRAGLTRGSSLGHFCAPPVLQLRQLPLGRR